jgi:phosphate transport system permease protein
MADTSIERRQTLAPPRTIIRERTANRTLNKRTRPGESLIQTILWLCGVLSIFTTLGIVFVLGRETLLFFDSKAFTLAKTPIVDESVSATLTETVEPGETRLSISYDGDRVPFANNQFIKVGDEVMQVTDRGRTTITVQRGADSTSALTHETDTILQGMREVQIKPTSDISAEDTVIPIEAGYGHEFSEGDTIQISSEIMKVVGVTPDSVTVERGQEGTEARAHSTGDALEIAHEVSLIEFVTSTKWVPQIGKFGIWPLLLSTLLISLIALLVAIPFGLGAAIYLSEYAPRGVRNVLKPALEVLAGIPTVVFGFFALTFVTPGLQAIFGNSVEFSNMLSAGLVVGILIIPLVSSLSEDALSAVPTSLREASYGLGATKLETTVKVILPAAISGVLAACILAMSRAVGETMIVAIAAGSGPNFTFNIFKGAETMTGHIARISGGDLSYNSIDYNSIFAIGFVLFLMTLMLNLLSGIVSRRLREAY